MKKWIYPLVGAVLWGIFVREMAPDLSNFSSWICVAAGIGAIYFLSIGAVSSVFKEGEIPNTRSLSQNESTRE